MKVLKDEKMDLKTPCKGKGKCLKCLCTAEGKVSEPSKREIKLLGDKKIKEGVRLACEVIIEGDATIKKIQKVINLSGACQKGFSLYHLCLKNY